MSRIRKFWRLNPREKQELLIALWMVLHIRCALWLMPFKRVLARAEQSTAPQAAGCDLEIERIAWRVTAVSRFVPLATCLTQALALQVLLRRRGVHSELKLGVKNDSNELQAHAWVERDGKVLIGAGPEVDRYAAFPSLQRH